MRELVKFQNGYNVSRISFRHGFLGRVLVAVNRIVGRARKALHEEYRKELMVGRYYQKARRRRIFLAG